MNAKKQTGAACIAGGSIGGLFAAAALMRAGWDVTVFERVDTELAGRGAGIVTHEPLIEALHAVGVSTEDLGVPVQDRVAFDIEGRVVRRTPYPQIMTSWDRIHQLLRARLPDEAYQTGKAVAGYETGDDSVVVRLADGGSVEADLLVGADGFRSAVRAQMTPDVTPEFAGYVVWRAVIDEADMTPTTHEQVFGAFGFYAPNGSQIIGYPIAGAGNDLRTGRRRYNFVWYRSATPEELRDMLTDDQGRHHPISIPPPLVRSALHRQVAREGEALLPPPFAEILKQCEKPFFTPIYDHCSPVFAEGRVALAGDAACVARPHVGMGVTKAAEDALALARHLSAGPISSALAAYSAERAPAGRRAYEQARRLGRHVFDTDLSLNQDGRSHPMIDAIMTETAIPVA